MFFFSLSQENSQLQKDLSNVEIVSCFFAILESLNKLQMEEKIKQELKTLRENITTMEQVN